MAYAFESASFSGRTRAAASVNEPLSVFRTRRRKAVSTSCKPASHESHNLVEAGPEVTGMEAFQEMFAASRSKFVAMAHGILRNREDAEDAVQNASLSAYRNLRAFEGRSGLKTWFTRIVMNAALMIRRNQKTWRVGTLPEFSSTDDIAWTETIRTTEPDPEMICTNQEAFELIDDLLEKLSPSLRQAFAMTYFDELSGREASALLGISAATFKARLFRARQRLISNARRRLRGAVRRTSQSEISSDTDCFQSPPAPPERSPLEVAFS